MKTVGEKCGSGKENHYHVPSTHSMLKNHQQYPSPPTHTHAHNTLPTPRTDTYKHCLHPERYMAREVYILYSNLAESYTNDSTANSDVESTHCVLMKKYSCLEPPLLVKCETKKMVLNIPAVFSDETQDKIASARNPNNASHDMGV